MLDVHAPHQSAHTLKDFLIHIAAITIGLLIALGLEATVEWPCPIRRRCFQPVRNSLLSRFTPRCV
jgi:hypothetical protein